MDKLDTLQFDGECYTIGFTSDEVRPREIAADEISIYTGVFDTPEPKILLPLLKRVVRLAESTHIEDIKMKQHRRLQFIYARLNGTATRQLMWRGRKYLEIVMLDMGAEAVRLLVAVTADDTCVWFSDVGPPTVR